MVNPPKSEPQPKPRKSESLGMGSRHPYSAQLPGSSTAQPGDPVYELEPQSQAAWACTHRFHSVVMKFNPEGNRWGKKQFLLPSHFWFAKILYPLEFPADLHLSLGIFQYIHSDSSSLGAFLKNPHSD